MASVEIPFAASANTQGTYDRILDVSESLFAKLGIVGTSVRTITDEAHVNVAAVNYHFGTKDNLVHAVIKRRFESLEQERADALDQIEELCARENRAPKPYELASVLISPTFAHIKSGDEIKAEMQKMYDRNKPFVYDYQDPDQTEKEDVDLDFDIEVDN